MRRMSQKDRVVVITETEQNFFFFFFFFFNKHSLRDSGATLGLTNTRIIGVPEEERKGQGIHLKTQELETSLT